MPDLPLPPVLQTALKEWSVAIRALREGRQIFLLRKGGIFDSGGEFRVESRDVLLFPTFEHQMEQAGTLQPCYGTWLDEELARKPAGEAVRIDSCARITDIVEVRDFDALLKLGNQHIYSEKFVRFRIENEPHKPLYCLFLRTYDLPEPATLPMAMDYYGCRSWIQLEDPLPMEGAVPAMSDTAYAERVRLTKELLGV